RRRVGDLAARDLDLGVDEERRRVRGLALEDVFDDLLPLLDPALALLAVAHFDEDLGLAQLRVRPRRVERNPLLRRLDLPARLSRRLERPRAGGVAGAVVGEEEEAGGVVGPLARRLLDERVRLGGVAARALEPREDLDQVDLVRRLRDALLQRLDRLLLAPGG